jgi:hypothetical protein
MSCPRARVARGVCAVTSVASTSPGAESCAGVEGWMAPGLSAAEISVAEALGWMGMGRGLVEAGHSGVAAAHSLAEGSR